MVVIRPARVTDAAAIAKVQVESWRTTYPGALPDTYLVSLSPARIAARWRAQLTKPRPDERSYVVGLPRAGIVGFGTCGPQRSKLAGFRGEFYTLYLLDHVQGQGLGRRLIGAMAGHLLEQGVRSAVVWVLSSNPARWFYERCGGTRLAEQPMEFAGASLVEVAYGWRDLVPLARLPADPPT